MAITPFQQAVLKIVRLIPPGMVMSYGQVATHLGAPRAARQVGWALRSLDGTSGFPWWRVLNKSGQITIKGNLLSNAQLQKELLEAEGVEVSEDFTLNIHKYRFIPDQALQQSFAFDKDAIPPNI